MHQRHAVFTVEIVQAGNGDLAGLQRGPESRALSDQRMVAQLRMIFFRVERGRSIAAVPEGDGVFLLIQIDHIGNEGALTVQQQGFHHLGDARVNVALATDVDAVVRQASQDCARLRV